MKGGAGQLKLLSAMLMFSFVLIVLVIAQKESEETPFLLQTPKLSVLLKKEILKKANARREEPLNVDVLVFLKKMDLGPYYKVNDIDSRAKALVHDLQKYAEMSQQLVVEKIKKYKVEYKTYWISNAISIRQCPIELLQWLSVHPIVDEVKSDMPFKVSLPRDVERPAISNGIEWNVEWIQAPHVWNTTSRGEGIIVAVADTGIQYDHPALIEKYRGYDIKTKQSSHDYNWWDSIHSPISGGSKCGYNVSHPCDDYGHGTHCMGTVVGSTEEHQIGVAPSAKFIGCRNMDAGTGRGSTYIECLQFFMAPTDLNGQNPKPELRPHVVSNSYGCPSIEKCEPDTLKDATDSITAAGVMMVIAAGNSGPGCSTADDPPGIYESAYTVGALGKQTNEIAYYSSRGPVTSDKSGRMKPDICAPGSSVLSSFPPNTYASLSGTSMATPHVAGSVALLWSSVKSLQRDLKATEQIFNKSAIKRSVQNQCSSSGVPNNVYGHGVIQIYDAIQSTK